MSTVPLKLLHEAEGHVVSIELKNGELYRGKLVEVSAPLSGYNACLNVTKCPYTLQPTHDLPEIKLGH